MNIVKSRQCKSATLSKIFAGASRDDSRSGAVIIEYLLIVVVVLSGAFLIFAPRKDTQLYKDIRWDYRKNVVIIGLPML